MGTVAGERTRSIIDFIVILTGVALVGFSIWGAPLAAGERPSGEVRSFALIWLVYAAAGALTLLSQFLAQRWGGRPLARGLQIVAGVILLLGLIGTRDFGMRSLLTMALPALVLFATVPFVGPIPVDRSPSEPPVHGRTRA